MTQYIEDPSDINRSDFQVKLRVGGGYVCKISVDDLFRRQNCILLVEKSVFAKIVDDSRNGRDSFSLTNDEEILGS